MPIKQTIVEKNISHLSFDNIQRNKYKYMYLSLISCRNCKIPLISRFVFPLKKYSRIRSSNPLIINYVKYNHALLLSYRLY